MVHLRIVNGKCKYINLTGAKHPLPLPHTSQPKKSIMCVSGFNSEKKLVWQIGIIIYSNILIFYRCTLSKSSNRAVGKFSIVGQINNIQKVPLFQRKVFYIRGDSSNFHFDPSIYSFSIAWKRWVPWFVKPHIIIQFLGLKTEKNNGNLSFLRKR